MQVCDDLQHGRSLVGLVNPSDPFTEEATLAQIKKVVHRATAAQPLQIAPPVASNTCVAGLADSATHTVTLRLGEVDALCIRVKYDPDDTRIRITGFWIPTPTP
jgi:hypothetical protein